MSGTRVVSILKAADDVFIHGGKLYKTCKREKSHFEYSLGQGCFLKLEQPETPQPKPAAPSSDGDAQATDTQPAPLPTPAPYKLIWKMPLCHVRCVYACGGEKQFVMQFFSFKQARKDPQKVQLASAKSAAIQDFYSNCTVAKTVKPEVRLRDFSAPTDVEQAEWLLVFQAVLQNYWHRRLEASVVAAPEIYQAHWWCVESNKESLRQVALSTSRLYVMPRHDASKFAVDEVSKAVSVASLSECQIKMEYRSVLLAFRGAQDVLMVFFSAEELLRAVAEVRRVWMMLVGRDAAFPLSKK